MANSDIREGFLCPICMKDLFTLGQLTEHFEAEHANEDKAVLQQLKGFFGKAKKKILAIGLEKDENFLDDVKNSVSSSTDPVGGIDPTLWEPQELGQIRSHTDYFKPIRDERIDRYVVETNKLLIRLDKLIGSNVPTEAGKRKAYEQQIVPWAPDADVKLCMTCGQRFTLLKRRHHCRLCGGIMCDRCSHFLPFSFANKLVNPAFKNEEGTGFLKRSGSNSSLNSMMTPEGELHVRSCLECRKLLERHDQQIEQRSNKPVIAQYYEKMRLCTEEADKWLPKYVNMAESLRQGESTYGLQEAQLIRQKLAKLFETVDLASKKIATLGINDQDNPPPPALCKLQSAIRHHATIYLQDHSFGLLPLPSEQELKQLQEARQAEIQRRIELERQQALEAQERERRKQEEKRQRELDSKLKTQSNLRGRTNSGSMTKVGWIPQEVVNNDSSDDPMIQQINIIKGYVKQAKQAHKWDEVQMLEMNLKELQTEYYRQMKQDFQEEQ